MEQRASAEADDVVKPVTHKLNRIAPLEAPRGHISLLFVYGALRSMLSLFGSRPPVLLKRGQPLALCGRQGIYPIARQCHKGRCQAVPVNGLAMLALDLPRLT